MGQIKEGEERTILVANIRKVLQVALIDTSIEWTSPLGQQVKREIEHRLGDKDGFDLVIDLGRLDTLQPGSVDRISRPFTWE